MRVETEKNPQAKRPYFSENRCEVIVTWSLIDMSVSFLPMRSWTSRYLATHRSMQTDSPFWSSAWTKNVNQKGEKNRIVHIYSRSWRCPKIRAAPHSHWVIQNYPSHLTGSLGAQSYLLVMELKISEWSCFLVYHLTRFQRGPFFFP